MLNLELLKNLSPPGMFTRIDKDLEVELQALPETLERVRGCVHFCWQLDVQKYGVQEDALADAKVRQKYLRAALSEYVSMEDAVRIDFSNSGRTVKPLSILDIPNPHLHIVRLLRHANIHLTCSLLSRSSRLAEWKGPDGMLEFEHYFYIVENLENTIRATRDAKHYDVKEINRMIEWLAGEQLEWGISNVVLHATESYAAELITQWKDG